ncbi:MAG: ABC transporter, substrate-binding protein (cluster 3, basic aa/glutamine/opines) [uncultured Propionibacteriaceae bacterium]|uniref:ABC transporter, substrate-binding protein (Cluster 3, basic aa/glutamine/opines) n=1 Tax=uncultured Propionibacteriaceae bacterium TaxID=257457 RepID=A0A6J4P9P7_9ACTN|nr:MAG: ABC transporter, substrate-binding protein (cluster 3, basic aa/glutamine/opines) [uncultured Propionibacteriaceae bacterium]
MRVRFRAALVLATTSMLAVTACGSNSLGGEPATSSAPTTSASVNADLAAKLPEKIKSSGTIVVGTDASYAPNEFLASDGKTVQGMDVDLFNAVAAKLGVKTEWQPATFDTIIVGVTGGKFDVGVSSFTINEQRKKQVNMVSYFSAGTQWATPAGNPAGVEVDNPCGKTVGVQDKTVQQEDDLPARQAKCGSNKINILPFEGQDQATAAVVSGRADAMLADSPVTAYAVKQSAGKLELLGEVYEAAPYGYVVPNEETGFAEALAQALKEVKADGSYQAALSKWGVESGAIDDFAVNP